MTATNALGEYLRARRELVSPTDVGVRVTGVRRTPGLRREEVATLAGISADYYLRLEQVHERLGPRLRVEGTATQYVLSLGSAAAARTTRATRIRASQREIVPPGIRL